MTRIPHTKNILILKLYQFYLSVGICLHPQPTSIGMNLCLVSPPHRIISSLGISEPTQKWWRIWIWVWIWNLNISFSYRISKQRLWEGVPQPLDLESRTDLNGHQRLNNWPIPPNSLMNNWRNVLFGACILTTHVSSSKDVYDYPILIRRRGGAVRCAYSPNSDLGIDFDISTVILSPNYPFHIWYPQP